MEERSSLGWIVFVFICLQFCLDFILKRFIGLEEQQSYTIVVKLIKILFCGCLFFYIFKEKQHIDLLKNFSLLFLIFIIGRLALSKEIDFYDSRNEIRELGLYFASYLYFYFLNLLHLKSNTYKTLSSITLILIGLICCTVLIGASFDLSLFKTYHFRFGYMGVLHKSIVATYFFVSSILYVYYISYVQKTYSKVFFWFITITALLVGTKAIYLFLACLLGYHFFTFKLYKKKSNYTLLLFITLLGIIVIYLKKTMIITLFEVLIDVYNEHGFLTALMSFRDQILIEKASYYLENWSVLNYLFGGKIDSVGLFEMSLVDMFVFFGAIGLLFYLFFFYLCILHFLERQDSYFVIFAILIVLFISIFAGQLFINFSSMVYIGWIFYLIKLSVNRKGIN